MSPEGLQFVQACLTREAKRRISVEEALAHPWLRRALAAGQEGSSAGGEGAANNIVRSMMLQQQHLHPASRRADAPVAA